MPRNRQEVETRVLAFLKDAREAIETKDRPRVSFIAQTHGLSPVAAVAAQHAGAMECSGRSWTWTGGRVTKAMASEVQDRINDLYRRK